MASQHCIHSTNPPSSSPASINRDGGTSIANQFLQTHNLKLISASHNFVAFAPQTRTRPHGLKDPCLSPATKIPTNVSSHAQHEHALPTSCASSQNLISCAATYGTSCAVNATLLERTPTRNIMAPRSSRSHSLSQPLVQTVKQKLGRRWRTSVNDC